MTDYAEEKEILSTSTDLDDAIAVISKLLSECETVSGPFPGGGVYKLRVFYLFRKTRAAEIQSYPPVLGPSFSLDQKPWNMDDSDLDKN